MSKKFRPFWVIFAMSLILIVAGAGIFAASFPYKEGISSVVRDRFKHSVSIDETVSAEGVTDLDIHSVENLKIVTHDEPGFRLDMDYDYVLVGFGKTDIGIEKTGSRVTVRASMYSFLQLLSYTNKCDAVLYIPASYTGKIKVNMSSGELDMTATNTFSHAEIKITSGKITGTVNAGTANVKMSSGTITGAINANTVNLHMTSGSMTGAVTADSFSLDMSSGKADLALSVNKLDAELTSGTASFVLDKAVAFTADLSSGNLTVTMPYDDDLGLRAKLTSGRINNNYFGRLSETIHDSVTHKSPVDKNIELDMTSGTVTINKAA